MKPGVQFSPVAGAEPSSSDAAREVVAAAVAAADAAEAEAVRKERNWRKGYAKHFVTQTKLAARSTEAAIATSRAALDAFAKQFQFVAADGSCRPLHDAVREAVQGGSTDLGTVMIRGEGAGGTPPLRIPYHGVNLEGQALIDQANTWVSHGIIEPSAGKAIMDLCGHRSSWLDLRGKHFVLLGAASQMGPLRTLLEHGATVYAVDLPKRPALWARLIKLARTAPVGGALVVPVAAGVHAASAAEAEGDNAIAEAAGCDILTSAPSVAAWCAQSGAGQQLTMGTYVYLDGALFARVAAACDAIVAAVAEFRGGAQAPAGVRLAHLLSPTEVHLVPEEAQAEASRRYASWSPHALWEEPVRTLSGERALEPNRAMAIHQASGDKPLFVQDFLVDMQGPNYALAKALQKWRAVLAHADGHVCSATVGPATLTESITHNRIIAAGLLGGKHFGLEVFDVSTSTALLAAMLIWDLAAPAHETVAHPSTELRNPLELFVQNACHGGAWTVKYKMGTCAEVSVVLHFLAKGGKWALGAGALAAAFASQRARSKL